MFQMQAESHKDVIILRLTGDVFLPDVAQFNRELEEYLQTPGVAQVVLDLSQVGGMDNSGLGVLVSVRTKSQSKGRRLVLLTPAPHVAQLLKKAEIEGFFPTFESEEELKGYIPNAAE